MKFSKPDIVQKPEWTQIVNDVNALPPDGGDWAFRALDALSRDSDKLNWGPDGLLENVDASICSSFDLAWCSRSWPTPVPARWKYEAWMLREFKRAAFLYRNTLPAPADHLEWLALARHYERPGAAHDFREGLRLVPLPRRHGHRQQDTQAAAHQADLGAEAALRTAQRMVLRLRHLRRFRPGQLRRAVRIFFSPLPLLGWHG